MSGEELKITFKPEISDYPACHPTIYTRPTSLEREGQRATLFWCCSRHHQTCSTRCISSFVFKNGRRIKKDRSPRQTVDLQALNKATLRAFSLQHSQHTIPSKRKKTLDTWNGYNSVSLSDDSREATTFITEWERYRYKYTPHGFHTSNDGYIKRFDDITVDFPCTVRFIDGSLWQ